MHINTIRQHTINNNLSLNEVVDFLEKEDISYYYVSYNDEDIIESAKEEGIPLEDIEIYNLSGGYIGFQRGILWN